MPTIADMIAANTWRCEARRA